MIFYILYKSSEKIENKKDRWVKKDIFRFILYTVYFMFNMWFPHRILGHSTFFDLKKIPSNFMRSKLDNKEISFAFFDMFEGFYFF